MTWVEAAHESPYGRIEVSWRLDADRLDLSVTVPPGTSAEVVLPDGTTSNVGPGVHAFNGSPGGTGWTMSDLLSVGR